MARQQTLAEFYHWWFRQKRRELRRSTLANYESSFRLHLLPALGHLPLDALKVRQIEEVLLTLVEDGKQATAKNTKAAIRSMYSDAIRWDEATFNPAALARMPRGSIKPIIVTQVPTLADAFKIHPMSWAAASSGLRWGELCALQRSDVDLQAGTVTVDKALYRGIVGPPKSAASNRTAVILPEAEDEWMSWLKDGLIFPSPTGRYWTYSNWAKREWRPACMDAGITKWHFHDFRHTYATTLIEKGIPAPMVAKTMGHSSAHVTMRIYAGFFEDSVSEVRKRLMGD